MNDLRISVYLEITLDELYARLQALDIVPTLENIAALGNALEIAAKQAAQKRLHEYDPEQEYAHAIEERNKHE